VNPAASRGASVEPAWTILGQGLAGTCLAWELWKRGEDFGIVDPGIGGSSRIAAGMINPITGKNFEPSWRIRDFLPEALEFYSRVEAELGSRFWYPSPVLRLAGTEKEWRKIVSKLDDPRVSPWVDTIVDPPVGWIGALGLKGGGRLDVPAFIEASRTFFMGNVRHRGSVTGEVIHCEGAAGLLTGSYGPHRCAKGEILTLRAPSWDGSSIRIGAGGWLVPLGDGVFKAGSTYEWNELDERPTDKGRLRVEDIATLLGGDDDFEVTEHRAGIRPILRRSQPLIGPLAGGGWMFNGLGSKGALYAPGMAARLADWMIEGREPGPELQFGEFLEQSGGDESS